jgi:hypothetical protein
MDCTDKNELDQASFPIHVISAIRCGLSVFQRGGRSAIELSVAFLNPTHQVFNNPAAPGRAC